jgi:HEAT repeat protein
MTVVSVRQGNESLVEKLQDPSRSNQALLTLLAKGNAAVAALAEFLNNSKPSSLPEARLLAVEGLTILKGPKALETLLGVASERLADISDPVIRLAEEAVASRAALGLAEFADEPRAVDRLLELLGGKPLIGVAEAFVKLRDVRAIPGLVCWLGEDFVAEPARQAILACGNVALPALLDSLRYKEIRHGSETGTSQRRRARILAILCELASSASIDALDGLLDDPVESVRWNAVRLFLEKGTTVQKERALRVAMVFLDSSDSFVRSECEELLAAHFGSGQEIIEKEINRRRMMREKENNFEPRETTLAVLNRILRKGRASKDHRHDETPVNSGTEQVQTRRPK